jgi:hypothetical protein
MAESGLAEVMEGVFGEVSKMLSGKKFPQNIRAMHLVMEELIRNYVVGQRVTTHDSLLKVLENMAEGSKTAKLWVNFFLKPVLLMMLCVRAEREGYWSLHLLTVKMLPYFYAASHVHYARYALLYLRNMESLPSNVLKLFVGGEHAMRHIPELFNGI